MCAVRQAVAAAKSPQCCFRQHWVSAGSPFTQLGQVIGQAAIPHGDSYVAQQAAQLGPLHGGLPTDRCVAEWWLASPHAEAVLAGRTPARNIVERIEVPADIDIIRREEPRRAREIQKSPGARLTSGFDRGLAVIGFERSDSLGTYLLGRWECGSNA